MMMNIIQLVGGGRGGGEENGNVNPVIHKTHINSIKLRLYEILYTHARGEMWKNLHRTRKKYFSSFVQKASEFVCVNCVRWSNVRGRR
jgi:hypothetical protein